MSGRDLTVGDPACLPRMPVLDGKGAGKAARRSHAAAIYKGDGDLDWVAAWARGAAGAGSPLHIAVARETMRVIRDCWREVPQNACFANMTEIGRNPARIIAEGNSFADENPGLHVWCLWEPAWPERSESELAEVARHEVLCNVAFTGKPMTILCLYDATRLSPEVIRNAEQTHPFVISGGRERASVPYLGAGRYPPVCDKPLAPPPGNAEALVFGGMLGPVREFAASHALAAGLQPARVMDLVLAVSEIAANALGHGRGRGIARFWRTGEEVMVQLEDSGHIADPLVGRRRHPPEALGGHGLWLVHQVCDLVEQRTGPDGTTTRLHMRLAGQP